MERYEEARAFVIEYHANGDANHPIVDLEMDEMRASMREQGILSWRNFFDLRVLFKSRARRYRMMLNIAMSWFGQFSGSYFFGFEVLWFNGSGHWNSTLIISREQYCIVLSSTACCKCRHNRPEYSSLTQWNLCSYRMDRGWLWSSATRRCWTPEDVVWKVLHHHVAPTFLLLNLTTYQRSWNGCLSSHCCRYDYRNLF